MTAADLIAKDHRKAFAPVPGSWGAGGATTILLRAAKTTTLRRS